MDGGSEGSMWKDRCKKILTYFRRQGRVGTKKVPDTILCMLTEANQYKCVSFPTHLHL